MNDGWHEVSGGRLRWRDLVARAFRAGAADLTHGSVHAAVVLLAIPMVLEMAMESVFALTDIWFVARLGAAAVAAVGLTEAVMTLVYAVAVGLGMGVTALVARRVGEGDDRGAARVTGQALWLGGLTAVLVAAIGVTGGTAVLRAMGAGEDVIATGAGYTRLLLGGAASVVFIFVLNAAYRGAGLPAIAMRALVLANALNIALDPCFIFGLGPFPELGVTGAALATTLGRSVGVAYLLYKLAGRQPHLALGRADLRFDVRLSWHLLAVSAGGILQFLVATASWVFLMRLVAAFGGVAVAGYTIAVRIIDITILPAWGFSNAAATLVGQNLGAGAPGRAREAVRVVMVYTVGYMAVVGGLFVVAGPSLVGFFTADETVIAHGVACLALVGLGYGFLGLSMTLTQAFNGAGDTWTPTWINLVGFWALQLPLAWGLAKVADLGPRGVFVAIAVAELAVALVAWAWFRSGRWTRVRV
ncbi:MAG: MATE family efflux transporter [Gammaproteobacteria bacterium]